MSVVAIGALVGVVYGAFIAVCIVGGWRFAERRRTRPCALGDHDWFPASGPSQFIPTSAVCLRCGERRVARPWGDCLGGDHPLAAHYDLDGAPRAVEGCVGPR